jgi:hypothetical protein
MLPLTQFVVGPARAGMTVSWRPSLMPLWTALLSPLLWHGSSNYTSSSLTQPLPHPQTSPWCSLQTCQGRGSQIAAGRGSASGWRTWAVLGSSGPHTSQLQWMHPGWLQRLLRRWHTPCQGRSAGIGHAFPPQPRQLWQGQGTCTFQQLGLLDALLISPGRSLTSSGQTRAHHGSGHSQQVV